MSYPDTVQTLLNDWAMSKPELATLAQSAVDTFSVHPAQLDSQVKYGGVLFSHAQDIGGVFLYNAHVSLEFSQGAQLSAPTGVLQGKGKFRRHIKLTVNDALDVPLLTDLITQAVNLVKTGE